MDNQERCAECKFYVPGIGECRRRSPVTDTYVLPGPKYNDHISRWPQVSSYDWCGDFKDRSEKRV